MGPASTGSPQERVYRMDASGWMFFVFTALFTMFMVGFLFRGDDQAPIVLFFLVLAWFWFNVLLNPFQVRLDSDGVVEFRSLVRRPRVRVRDLRRIRLYSMNMGMVFVHAKGKIWVRFGLRGSFDLLTRLQQVNPSLEIQS